MVIAHKWIKLGYKVITVLNILEVSKSSYYYKVKQEKDQRSYANTGRRIPGFSYSFNGIKINDLDIQNYIVKIKSQKTSKFYGYKKVTVVLRNNYNIKINKKKVRRLMKNLSLLDTDRKRTLKRVSRV
ncbi:IS3 family transposase [Clostridium ihumii]|uniref:IS3 family transposase n=1 Tax=Clostridium ihumii TaxID=1470356 RepID=UPI000C76E52E